MHTLGTHQPERARWCLYHPLVFTGVNFRGDDFRVCRSFSLGVVVPEALQATARDHPPTARPFSQLPARSLQFVHTTLHSEDCSKRISTQRADVTHIVHHEGKPITTLVPLAVTLPLINQMRCTKRADPARYQ